MQMITRGRAPVANADDAPAQGDGTEPPLRSSRRRLVLLVAAAVFVGAVAGVAVVLALRTADTSKQDAEGALRSSDAAVVRASRQLSAAQRLADVRSAAQSADAASASVRGRLDEIDHITDRKTRDAVRQMISADVATLEAFARLADLEPAALRDWDETSVAIQTAQTAIEAGAPTVRELNLTRAGPAPGATVTSARTHLDSLLSDAQHRYVRWRRRYTEARKDRDADIAVIDTYAGAVRGQLTEYSRLRTETSNWIDKVDSEGVTFQQAYDFLDQAATSRREVRAAIASTDPPGAVATAHNELLGTVDQALSAIDAAYDGTVDYQFDLESEYSNYRETPGWDKFKTESERISGRYASAQSSWETAVGNARSALTHKRLPKEPDL